MRFVSFFKPRGGAKRRPTKVRHTRPSVEALEERNTDLAEKLARDHTLSLAAYVEAHGKELF